MLETNYYYDFVMAMAAMAGQMDKENRYRKLQRKMSEKALKAQLNLKESFNSYRK